jgi:DNA-binding phage protein
MLKKDRSVGKQLFSFATEDPTVLVQHALVHELAHAFTGRLGLPLWLNEGLAQVTVDRFFDFQTISNETLDALKTRSGHPRSSYRNMHKADKDEIHYRYAHGYWLTKYLSETRPALLPSLLKKRRSARGLEKRIARAFGMRRRGFWRSINEQVVKHYSS